MAPTPAYRTITLTILVLVIGCSTSLKAPDLGGLYNRTAQYHGQERNPVIVIPGILGSKLIDQASGRTVWGAFGGEYADPALAQNVRLISLPIDTGIPLYALVDDVK